MKVIITKFKNLSIIIVSILLILAFFTNAKYISDGIITSLKFCVYTLIPSLFPYMFVSTMLSSYMPISIGVSRFFNYLSNFLGICKKYTSAIILGNVCGFVCGPKIICELSDSPVDKNEFTKAIFLSSNAGIGFVISFIGITIYDNFLFGLYLYFSQLLFSLLLSKLFFRRKSSDKKDTNSQLKSTSIFSAFTKSISSTTNTLILISSYTVLFSIFISLLNTVANFSKSHTLKLLIIPILEISQGITYSLECKNTILCAFIIGFSLGFSGICVIFQIFSICEGQNLNKIKFVLLKLLQGILLGIISSIFAGFFEIIPIKSVNLQNDKANIGTVIIIYIIIFLSLTKIKNKIFKFLC